MEDICRQKWNSSICCNWLISHRDYRCISTGYYKVRRSQLLPLWGLPDSGGWVCIKDEHRVHDFLIPIFFALHGEFCKLTFWSGGTLFFLSCIKIKGNLLCFIIPLHQHWALQNPKLLSQPCWNLPAIYQLFILKRGGKNMLLTQHFCNVLNVTFVTV